MQHYCLFEKFKPGLFRVFERCKEVGAMIFMEWPKLCTLWDDSEIMQSLKQYGLVRTKFHGCQFGLPSIRPGCRGQPLNKAWFGVTDDTHVASGLRMICNDRDCRSRHVPVKGDDAKRAEQYTMSLAKTIHYLFENTAYRLMQKHCTHDDIYNAPIPTM